MMSSIFSLTFNMVVVKEFQKFSFDVAIDLIEMLLTSSYMLRSDWYSKATSLYIFWVKITIQRKNEKLNDYFVFCNNICIYIENIKGI